MKILYFSTSIIPSQFANSVHVMKMCSALKEQGQDVTLVAMQGNENKDVFDSYNVNNKFNLITLDTKKFAVLKKIKAIFQLAPKYDLIYTRYALAAFISSLFLNKTVVYEYHSEAVGKINRFFEKSISSRKKVCHVFITSALKNQYLSKNPRLKKASHIVLPDCADIPEYTPEPISQDKKLSCGYIGSFQKGKGVEIVMQTAQQMPQNIFHIVGGTQEEIEKFKLTAPSNIVWHGFLDTKVAMKILQNDIDIALLPNQKNVFVGKKKNVNIGQWTSPMKLFEYMSFGKAIVASNIPVLCEILKDRENSILVEPDKISDWVAAIEQLNNDTNLLNSIRFNGRQEMEKKYTWNIRAQKIIEKIEQRRA